MAKTRVTLGRRGEALAAEKLTALGYAIVGRNYRCPAGEIDLIARRDGAWVFVEVRTRRGTTYGTPEQSITARKRAHMLAAAQAYLAEHQLAEVDWQLDVVAVELSPRGELLRIAVIENAVTG
jgi:putative endonuclease